MEGATWADERLQLENGESIRLKPSQLCWSRDKAQKGNSIEVPVYLNSDRTDILFTMDIDAEGVSYAEIVQRGVCLTAVTN